jgi:transcriptional regulator with XRE-family HTH domain
VSTGIYGFRRAVELENAENSRNHMTERDILGVVEPEKKYASGSVAQGEAVEPEASRVLAGKIQDVRKAVLGSLVTAAAALGFNKNTIDSYERDKTLPDIDFLVVFAAKTGVDLKELIRLRLAASRYPEARALAGSIEVAQIATPAEIAGKPVPGVAKALEALANPVEYLAREQSAHPDAEPDYALLESLIRFAERRLSRNITPMLLQKIEQVLEAWGPIADGRPDLAARMNRIKASVELLHLDEHQ